MTFEVFVFFNTLPNGLLSTGAPKAPPARDFFKFSLTCVILSSRSTRSPSFIWQLSSRWATHSLSASRCLSAPKTHRINTENKKIKQCHRKCANLSLMAAKTVYIRSCDTCCCLQLIFFLIACFASILWKAL